MRDGWVTPGDRTNTPLRDVHGEVVRGKDNKAKAYQVWHGQQAAFHAGRAGADNPVKAVLDLYLQDAGRRVGEKTLNDYRV